MNLLSYLFAIAAGSANPVQAGANAQLSKGLTSAIWSALIVYAGGLCGVIVILAIARQAWPTNNLQAASLPWWAWAGGLLSIASTVAGLSLAHKMGSGVFTGISLTASLITSVILDHFALFGFKEHPASLPRLAGSGLLIAGIWLIARF